ncbi:MAG TPA: energy transducer TonB [Lacunisphaera sp.]|jgi:TonB family protein|nr:energy transducer TonB [Lacunisphaera sp.]
MNLRLPLVALVLLAGASQPALRAADVPPALAARRAGYQVVLDITMNEQGEAEDARVVRSDDPTKDALLERVALALAHKYKREPRVIDGKPVKYTVQAPFDFPVPGDKGPEANHWPMPHPTGKSGEFPKYPESLAAKDVVGGVVLELHVDKDGKLTAVNVLRASHQEFADSAKAAVNTWSFVPAMKDGVPVDSVCNTVFAYSVDGKDVDWQWRVAPRPSIGSSIVIRPPANLVPINPPPSGAPAPAPAEPDRPAAPGK